MVATLPAKRANEGASAAIQSANNAVLAGRTFGEHSGIDEGTLSKKNNSDSVSVLAQVKRDDYARELEERVRAILSQVEGVGEVDVLIVLKSTGEKVVHSDVSENKSSIKEKDAQGGERAQSSLQREEAAVVAVSEPFVEKELYPELSGIVISAQGGGSPAVQAQISQAMEALFGLPQHKIKVLKRAN